MQVRNVYTDDKPWAAQLVDMPTCIALEPRIAERQTREVIVGTSDRTVLISRVRFAHPSRSAYIFSHQRISQG